MLIDNATYQRETLSERPIWQPLNKWTFLSIKANSHSCSHLLLKIHKPGQDYCSGDCITLSPPLLLSGLVGSVVVGLLLKGIKLLKLAAFFVNFPSLVQNIFYFFLWPRSNRKIAKIILVAKTKDYSPRHARIICLRPACTQQKTHGVLHAAAYWLSYF